MPNPWWPDGAANPAFTTQRRPYGAVQGGDYVRARSGGITTLPQAAVRFVSRPKGWDAIANEALLVARPFDYSTMEIAWGWPTNIGTDWLEVALVRSGFGRPITPADGMTVFHATRDALLIDFSLDGINILGPIVYDRGLPNGRWYYYSLFFLVNPVDWVVGMQSQSPLPKNYHHAEHLWNSLPPFYQHTDDQQRVDAGFLRQFLKVFGFELDLTREYIEQWQKLYHTDFTPIKLLRKLGDNFNVPYESGLGDIRYRGLVGTISQLTAKRGTTGGLKDLIMAASQYNCDITQGENIHLVPDDSEFVGSTGQWTALHPSLLSMGAPFPVTETNTKLTTAISYVVDFTTEPIPPVAQGRGVMKVIPTKVGTPGTALPNFALVCGCGQKQVPGPVTPGGSYTTIEKEFLPIYSAPAVKQGVLYGFSIWIKETHPASTNVGILWFHSGGKVVDFQSITTFSFGTPVSTNWFEYTVQALPPVGASYLVPYVLITGGVYDAPVYFAGSLVYGQGEESGSVSAFAPDRYLTLGDPAELIGANRPSPPFTGLLLGDPGAGG